jgi:pantetheine-phosphate adenylyltransferase
MTKKIQEDPELAFLHLKKFFSVYSLPEILIERWSQPHRFYHTVKHLDSLLRMIADRKLPAREDILLKYIALFHDVVYDPRKKDNEEQSVNIAKKLVPACLSKEVCNAIIDTKTHRGRSELSKIFCEMDLDILFNGSFADLLMMETLIAKEYQFASVGDYKKRRIEFLTGFCKQWAKRKPSNVAQLAEYVKGYRPKIGFYPGSFDPFHIGHMNILEKAEKIFDKVIVGVGVNPQKVTGQDAFAESYALKQVPLFPESTSDFAMAKAMKVRGVLPFHQIVVFRGLLTEAIKVLAKDADITVIRGLRSGYDLEYENNQTKVLEDIYPDYKVIYIPCDASVTHVSSTVIRALKAMGNSADNFFSQKFNYANKA